MVVTIAAADYGQAGGVTETLPAGFVYVSSSLDDGKVLVIGQKVRFHLARGCFLYLHRYRVQRGGALYFLRYPEGF